MELVFEDAVPVYGEEAPNPFADIVKAIAGKTDDKGIPLAKSVWLPAGTDDKTTKELNKSIRLLGDAGALTEPPVTVKKAISEPTDRETGKTVDVDGKPVKETVKMVKVTFWTAKRQNRERKNKTTDVPPVATTENKTEVPKVSDATPATVAPPSARKATPSPKVAAK